MSEAVQTESFSFQTEAQQILHLMIHSLYSEREIFLRELISNASDACDKLRFESLTDKSLLDDEGELCVEVSIDKKKRTITVRDNGIGMSRDEVIDNIGTIARSGTRGFLDALTGEQSNDARLIGQFGVGFYSVFMVADKVDPENPAWGPTGRQRCPVGIDRLGRVHPGPGRACAPRHRGHCAPAQAGK